MPDTMPSPDTSPATPPAPWDDLREIADRSHKRTRTALRYLARTVNERVVVQVIERSRGAVAALRSSAPGSRIGTVVQRQVGLAPVLDPLMVKLFGARPNGRTRVGASHARATPPFPRLTPVLYRTVFLSDLHLGAMGSRADLVLEFLRRHRAEKYFLVGDILDLWHPGPTQWTAAEQAVVDYFGALQLGGAEIVYITGNHDPSPDRASGLRRLPVSPCDHAIHEAADGRRYLITHGDGQDARLFRAHALTRICSRIDQKLRQLDKAVGYYFSRSETHRRSVIEFVLSSVNTALYPSRAHERRLVDLARAGGFDGVICGHFHMAALSDRHGLTYANCGDWVDSFTAVAEDFDGRLDLLGGRVAMAQDWQPGGVAGQAWA